MCFDPKKLLHLFHMNDQHYQLREKYKSLSDFEIVNIIENASMYLAHAVELAKEELKTRNLSEGELADILKEVNTRKQSLIEDEIRGEQQVQYIRDLFKISWELLNPLKPHTDKLVNIIILILTYQYAETILSLFEEIQWMDFGFEFLYIIDFIVAGLAIFLLIKRNKWGWFVLSFNSWNLFFYWTLNLYHSLKLFFSFASNINENDSGIGSLISIIEEYEFHYVIDDILLFCYSVLWLIIISSKNMLTYFSLKKSAINYTLLVAVLFNVLIYLSMLFM